MLIETLIDEGVDGLVLAGTGAGLVSGVERTALERAARLPAAERPVVVRSNRTGSGRVLPLPAYDERGMVAGDTLNPQKARILLMLALTKTRDLDEIRRIFRGVTDARRPPRISAAGATLRSRWKFRWRETSTAQAPGAEPEFRASSRGCTTDL